MSWLEPVRGALDEGPCRVFFRHDDAGWVTTYEHHAAAGTWVSLRSTVTMADGSTAKQTIMHAYRLR